LINLRVFLNFDILYTHEKQNVGTLKNKKYHKKPMYKYYINMFNLKIVRSIHCTNVKTNNYNEAKLKKRKSPIYYTLVNYKLNNR